LRKLDKAPPMADECMFIGPLGLGCVVLKHFVKSHNIKQT